VGGKMSSYYTSSLLFHSSTMFLIN